MTSPQHGRMESTVVVDGELLRRLEDAVRELVADDEMLVHFDVLVETRCVPDSTKIRFRRFTAPGSDPLLSLGLLTACTTRLKKKLGLGEL